MNIYFLLSKTSLKLFGLFYIKYELSSLCHIFYFFLYAFLLNFLFHPGFNFHDHSVMTAKGMFQYIFSSCLLSDKEKNSYKM